MTKNFQFESRLALRVLLLVASICVQVMVVLEIQEDKYLVGEVRRENKLGASWEDTVHISEQIESSLGDSQVKLIFGIGLTALAMLIPKGERQSDDQ